ncbi:MAG: fatty acid desaturase, partial [Bdellovibrionales bacterium]|nr:fatty acid desaturase [Bdellovibrionales bacterium]
MIILIVFFAGMFGVSMGYHRYLSHKSFKPVRWFELLIVFLGLPAGTPIQWAGNHRFHHRHADTDQDPHSPHYGGFWWAHNGWYIGSKNPFVCFLYALAGPLRSLFDGYHRPRSNQQYNYLAPDIAADPVFRFISRPWVYFCLVTLHTLGAFALAYYFTGTNGILIGYGCYLFVYNVGDSIDSWAHLWGPRNQGSKHQAT